jgi:AcrR family transcriptional regulator
MDSYNTSQVRWGIGIRSDATSARNRILDAAFRCYQTIGNKTSIRSIASEACISRPTVYRYFDTGHEILKALIRRTADEVRYGLLMEFRGQEAFGDYLVEALIQLFRDRTLGGEVRFMFEPEVLPVLHETLLQDREHLLTMSEAMKPFYSRSRDMAEASQPSDIIILCECFSRFTISYFTTPSQICHSDEQLRQLFRLMLSPLLQRTTPLKAALHC